MDKNIIDCGMELVNVNKVEYFYMDIHGQTFAHFESGTEIRLGAKLEEILEQVGRPINEEK